MNNIDLINGIKRDFFSFRNGIVADALKKLYPEGTKIYGLNVSQFIELAKKYPHEISLGKELLTDKNCRESRLFSLYILPHEQIDKSYAKMMIQNVVSTEEAEFLAFKILRHLPYASDLYQEMILDETLVDNPLYAVNMLKKNLDQI